MDDHEQIASHHVASHHGLAMGAPDVAPRQLAKAFETVVRTRGGRAEGDVDGPSEGIPVAVALHTFEVHGAWLLMSSEHEPPLSLARELSAKVGKPLIVHTVEVTQEVVEGPGDDALGYRNQYRSLDVRPDGSMGERDAPVDPEYAAVAHGSYAETAGAILWMMVTEQESFSPTGDPRTVVYVLPPPRTSKLPPRLAELATLINDSGGFSVQQVSGQTMVRLTLPDGSRRFSRVTPEELDQLRSTTGIDPK